MYRLDRYDLFWFEILMLIQWDKKVRFDVHHIPLEMEFEYKDNSVENWFEFEKKPNVVKTTLNQEELFEAAFSPFFVVLNRKLCTDYIVLLKIS